MTRRRGFTLVEGLVALGVFSLLALLLGDVYASGRRQGEQVEEHADLVVAALLLRDYLGRDLEGSIPLGALPAEARPRGVSLARLQLPVFRRYLGGEDEAVRFRPVGYAWDPGRRRLTREGEPILRGVPLSEVGFRWTEGSPWMLEVTLVGRDNARGKPARLAFQLPAPEGSEAFPAWVFAPHHRAPRAE